MTTVIEHSTSSSSAGDRMAPVGKKLLRLGIKALPVVLTAGCTPGAPGASIVNPIDAFVEGLIPNNGSITETPTPTITASPTESATPTATITNTPTITASPTESATPVVATTEAPFQGYPAESALRDAAQNLSNKTHESVETLYQEYVALYNSMPVMDNVATSSEAGLMPTVDFHNLTEATYTTHANAGGYTFLSTSFADLDIDGQKLSFPWKADDNRLIFVMGSEDGSTSKTVTIEKYPQGHGFTANATPDEFQRGKLNSSDKSVYDVWLADQIMQSIRGGSNQGIGVDQTVTIDFIDPRTNRVTEFIYDVNTKQWTKDGQPVASRSGVPVTPEVLTPQAPVTEAQAMDAAIQSLVRGGMTEADARTHFESIYGTLPRSMPFMADATQGLFPNILNGRTLMTEPSHDPKNPSEILNAAEHGLETFSGGYMFGIVDGKWDLQLPSTDGTAYNVYFIGKTSDAGPADRNTNIGLYDYAPQYNFTVGASPNKGQEAQYPNREVLDPVWVAEGVAQAHIANPNTKLVVEVFVDTETGTVTKFTYDLTQGKWLAPTTETLPTVR